MSDTTKNAKPKAAYEKKSRNCLLCSNTFVSAWPGERVCPSCKSTAFWRDGTATSGGL